MDDVPVEWIVAAFQDEAGADAALKELKQAKRKKLIGINNAAVIRKDEKGKIHINETAAIGRKGAPMGAATGAAIGLIAGSLTLAGVLAAKFTVAGFDDGRLKTIGEGLTPGSSAIIAVVKHKWVEQVRQELEEMQADVVTEAFAADIRD